MKNLKKYYFIICMCNAPILFSAEPPIEAVTPKSVTFLPGINPTLEQTLATYFIIQMVENPNLITSFENIQKEQKTKTIQELLESGELQKLTEGLPVNLKEFVVHATIIPSLKDLPKIAKFIRCLVDLAQDEDFKDFNVLEAALDPATLQIAQDENQQDRIELINCIKQYNLYDILCRKSLTDLWLTLFYNPYFKERLGNLQINHLLRDTFDILFVQNEFDTISFWFKKNQNVRKVILTHMMWLFDKQPNDLIKIFNKHLKEPITMMPNELKKTLTNNIIWLINETPETDALNHGLDFLVSKIFTSPFLIDATKFLPLLFKKGASPNVNVSFTGPAPERAQYTVTATEYLFGVYNPNWANQVAAKKYLEFIAFLVENGLDITPLRVDQNNWADQNSFLGRAQRIYHHVIQNHPEYNKIFDAAVNTYQQKLARQELREL